MVRPKADPYSAELLSVRFWRGDFSRPEGTAVPGWPRDTHVPGDISIPELPLDLPGPCKTPPAELPPGVIVPLPARLPPGVDVPLPTRLPPGVEIPMGTVYVEGSGGTLAEL